MAKSKVVKSDKIDATQSEKVEKVDEAKSPKRGRPATAKSPKAKVDSVKKIPMKAKADDVKAKAAKKPTTHPPASKMVAEALTSLKNRKGHTLAAIRSFIAKNYDCQVNKRIQVNIKNYIRSEFDAGRIKMVGIAEDDDDEAAEINFTKRFALIKWSGVIVYAAILVIIK